MRKLVLVILRPLWLTLAFLGTVLLIDHFTPWVQNLFDSMVLLPQTLGDRVLILSLPSLVIGVITSLIISYTNKQRGEIYRTPRNRVLASTDTGNEEKKPEKGLSYWSVNKIMLLSLMTIALLLVAGIIFSQKIGIGFPLVILFVFIIGMIVRAMSFPLGVDRDLNKLVKNPIDMNPPENATQKELDAWHKIVKEQKEKEKNEMRKIKARHLVSFRGFFKPRKIKKNEGAGLIFLVGTILMYLGTLGLLFVGYVYIQPYAGRAGNKLSFLKDWRYWGLAALLVGMYVLLRQHQKNKRQRKPLPTMIGWGLTLFGIVGVIFLSAGSFFPKSGEKQIAKVEQIGQKPTVKVEPKRDTPNQTETKKVTTEIVTTNKSSNPTWIEKEWNKKQGWMWISGLGLIIVTFIFWKLIALLSKEKPKRTPWFIRYSFIAAGFLLFLFGLSIIWPEETSKKEMVKTTTETKADSLRTGDDPKIEENPPVVIVTPEPKVMDTLPKIQPTVVTVPVEDTAKTNAIEREKVAVQQQRDSIVRKYEALKLSKDELAKAANQAIDSLKKALKDKPKVVETKDVAKNEEKKETKKPSKISKKATVKVFKPALKKQSFIVVTNPYPTGVPRKSNIQRIVQVTDVSAMRGRH